MQDKETNAINPSEVETSEFSAGVVTIRCLSAVPVDLEKLLAEVEASEADDQN